MDRQEFLKELFSGTGAFVEIREINGDVIKQLFYKVKDIDKYIPPQDTNVYYGVFDRNSRSGKAENCNTSRVVWADFDHMEIGEVKRRLNGFLEPSIWVNSGHGIHTYWLLNERTDKDIVSINRAIAFHTGADIKATDKARILRLPNTMNVKSEPKKCYVIENNNKRYDIAAFREILSIEEIAADKEIKADPIKEPPKELLNSERECIRNMAKGVKEGHRNFTLGRITKYLQVKGYTKVKAKEIILKWNLCNEPQESQEKILKDFEFYWKRDYKLLGCQVGNMELQSILSDYCNRYECNFSASISKLVLDNSIKYNNRLFSGISSLTGNDLIVLGVLIRHKEGLTTTKLIEKLTSRAIKKCCMIRRTLIQVLDTLQKLKMINVTEGNKRAGKENFYKYIPQGTFGTGYTIATNGAINGAIDGRVTPGEFKLYVLLLKYAFKKGNCYPSLDTLSKELRADKAMVSRQLKNLEKADYIKREYVYPKGIKKLVMTLLS